MNECISNFGLGCKTNNDNTGMSQYDHIVSIISISSNFDDDEAHDDDVLTIDDHGLYSAPGADPQYLFSNTLAKWGATRQFTNEMSYPSKGVVYSIPQCLDAACPPGGVFAMAYTGIIDDSSEILPVKLTVTPAPNSPNWAGGLPGLGGTTDKTPETVQCTNTGSISLDVTVSKLVVGNNYILYQYNDAGKVPNGAFNSKASAAFASFKFTATSPVFVQKVTVGICDQAFFRAVPAQGLLKSSATKMNAGAATTLVLIYKYIFNLRRIKYYIIIY
jgi:hypothetical protein